MNLDWFKDMNLFVTVARTKSFTQAACILGIPHSTLSRRITDWEKNLGFRLLNRTTRRVELTEDGSVFLMRIENMIEQAKEVHDELIERNSNISGHLRISMPPSFGSDQIAKWFAEFAKLYPDLSFDIDTSPIHVDLVKERYDVAFRIGNLPDSTLTVRRLTLLTPSLFATPEYLNFKDEIKHPKDLSNYQCLRLGGKPEESIWKFSKGHERVSVKLKGRFWFNDPIIGLSLVKESMGIASIIESRCADDVATGKLVRVLPHWKQDPIIVSAITPSRLLSAKTRAFIDFFTSKMKEY